MRRIALPSVVFATAALVAGCSSRVERFDYDYGTAHPEYNGGYSRLGGPRHAASAPERNGPMRAVTVASGDTLWAIARRHGVSDDALRHANHLNSDRLRVGQVLMVPPPRPADER